MIEVIMAIEDDLDQEVEVDQDHDRTGNVIVNLDHVVVVEIDVIELKVDQDLELDVIVNEIHRMIIENVQIQEIVRDRKKDDRNLKMIQNVKHQKNEMMWS